jgi:hypothetical protein
MRLPPDCTIALWLGHESPTTTNRYIECRLRDEGASAACPAGTARTAASLPPHGQAARLPRGPATMRSASTCPRRLWERPCPPLTQHSLELRIARRVRAQLRDAQSRRPASSRAGTGHTRAPRAPGRDRRASFTGRGGDEQRPGEDREQRDAGAVHEAPPCVRERLREEAVERERSAQPRESRRARR